MDEEPSKRGNWSGKLDFILSAVGFAVGLGNVWRFPYQAYENGGAVFLIPYVVFLFAAGLPLFFLEMSMGQFGSLGPISVWRLAPMFKGLGYSMVVISSLVVIYYNMIIAYTLYYTFASFAKELPWQHCKPEWVSDYNCVERVENYTQVLQDKADYCASLMSMGAAVPRNCTLAPRTPSEIYWNTVVLEKSNTITEGSDHFKWDLVLCLLLAWLIVFFCIVKGIKSSGKVVYVTATFPYVVLTILLIRNLLLPGASKGVEFYIVPKSHDIDKLKDAKVWQSAATQIAYSLGIAFGGLGTMASYNKFKNNIFRDALVVSILNCCTSVYAGLVIFSVIGNMAERTGMSIHNVTDSGPGLAFIAYPEGLASMPIPQLWSVLFFLMLFTLGLDSQFAMMETVITAIVDEFQLDRYRFGKLVCTTVTCVAFFLMGLPQCTRAGYHVMNLFNTYSASYALFVVAFLEVVVVAWVYPFYRFSDDIRLMIGNPCGGCFRYTLYFYWWPTWILITPAMVLFILVFMAKDHTAIDPDVYPAWADGLGWAMNALALSFIPLLAIIEMCKSCNFLQVLKSVIRPTMEWGPAQDADRIGTRYECMNPYDLKRRKSSGLPTSFGTVQNNDVILISNGKPVISVIDDSSTKF